MDKQVTDKGECTTQSTSQKKKGPCVQILFSSLYKCTATTTKAVDIMCPPAYAMPTTDQMALQLKLTPQYKLAKP